MDDDLPTNLDYLDDSFGSLAGTHGADDQEADEFSVHDADYARVDQEGVISLIGGETIKLLNSDLLRIVEHHFDTLLPESPETNRE